MIGNGYRVSSEGDKDVLELMILAVQLLSILKTTELYNFNCCAFMVCELYFNKKIKFKKNRPWLVWLSGFTVSLRTKGSLV